MTHRNSFFLLAFVSVFLAVAPLGANQLGPGEPINMSLKNASLTEVLQSFGAISGSRLEIGSDVEGEVTIDVESIPWTRALDRVCRSHDLFCAMLGGDPPTLRVRRVDPAAALPVPAGFAEAINVSLERADLVEMLRSFGTLAGVDVEIGEGIRGSVTLEVQGAPWSAVFAEVCRLNACRVEWGENSIRVVAAEAGEIPVVNMSLKDADLEEFLRSFAVFGILGSTELEVEIDPEIEGGVTVELEQVTWPQALGILCDQLDCGWRVVYGDPPVLKLFPARSEEKVASGLADPGAAAKKLTYRFAAPGGATIEGTAAFTWAEPIRILVSEGPYRARLSWIPFGPDLSVLLPVVERCDGARGSVALLDPIVLPLEGEVRRQAEGAVVALAPAEAEAHASPRPKGEAAACGPEPAGRIEVSVRRVAEGGEGDRPRPKRLRTVESYLLVRPVETRDPVAAVIALGATLDGRRSLALLTPSEDRRGVEVETLSLGLGDEVEKVVRGDGRSFELAIGYLAARAD